MANSCGGVVKQGEWTFTGHLCRAHPFPLLAALQPRGFGAFSSLLPSQLKRVKEPIWAHRVRAGIGPRPSAYKFLAPPPCLPAILYSSGLKEIECVHMCSSVAFPGKVQNLLQGKLTMGSGCIHITASLGIKGLDWTSPQLLPSWEGTAQTNTVWEPMLSGSWAQSVKSMCSMQGSHRLLERKYSLEEAVALLKPLAWRIPGTGEPGGLPSVGSHRVGHDWSNLAAAGRNASWGREEIIGSRRSWERLRVGERDDRGQDG